MNAAAVLINGAPATTLGISDRGFQYGDGVFRTAIFAEQHLIDASMQLSKLAADAAAIHLPEIDKECWLKDIKSLTEDLASDAVIKLIWTRGQGGRGYRAEEGVEPTRIVACYPLPELPAQYWSEGVEVYLCKTPLGENPRLAGIKHLNRLEQVLARYEFGNSHQEGLMSDLHGHVISGTMSNIFIVSNSELQTPSLKMCGIEGLMRSKIISLAQKLDIPVNIRQLNMKDLQSADEVFLTNSLIGIWPVKNISVRNSSPGKITQLLQKELRHPRIPA